jgi:hypothetical protein
LRTFSTLYLKVCHGIRWLLSSFGFWSLTCAFHSQFLLAIIELVSESLDLHDHICNRLLHPLQLCCILNLNQNQVSNSDVLRETGSKYRHRPTGDDYFFGAQNTMESSTLSFQYNLFLFLNGRGSTCAQLLERSNKKNILRKSQKCSFPLYLLKLSGITWKAKVSKNCDLQVTNGIF